MNATITGNQLVLSSDTATVATAETFALTFVPDWVYPEIYVRAEQDDTRVEVLVSEGSAVVPLGVGTWDISVVGRKNGTDLVTNKVKLYVDRPDIHHIVSEEAGNMITELDDGLYFAYPTDTGWVQVPSAWYATDITAGSSPLKYRKIGNTVHFYGGLTTTVQRDAKTSYIAITLPAALNPSETSPIPQVNFNFDACVATVVSGHIKWWNTAMLGANKLMFFHLSYLTD